MSKDNQHNPLTKNTMTQLPVFSTLPPLVWKTTLLLFPSCKVNSNLVLTQWHKCIIRGCSPMHNYWRVNLPITVWPTCKQTRT